MASIAASHTKQHSHRRVLVVEGLTTLWVHHCRAKIRALRTDASGVSYINNVLFGLLFFGLVKVSPPPPRNRRVGGVCESIVVDHWPR